MTIDIPSEIQEEVDELIQRVADFQTKVGRKIAKHIRRSRKGRKYFAALESFGLEVPPAYAAMYWNFNGAEPGATMAWHQMSVFLEYRWDDLDTVVLINHGTRNPKRRPVEFTSPDRLWAFSEDTTNATSLEFRPALRAEGEIPLVAVVGALSHVEYIAFDSCMSFLRTVVEAQEAGIIRYDMEQRVLYPIDELLSVVELHNSRQNYWSARAKDEVDWQIPREGQP